MIFEAAPSTTYLIVVDASPLTTQCSGVVVARDFELEVTVMPNEAGQCDDGFDNDGDGFVDCDDPDCAGDAACQGVSGSSCDGPLEVLGEVTFVANTCNYGNDFHAVSGGGCEQTAPFHATSDYIVEFTAPAAGQHRVQLDATFSAIVNVVDGAAGCPASPIDTCVGGARPPGATVDFSAQAAGDVFYIVVDGYGVFCGDTVLAIRGVHPEICDDDVDNDLDGATDCDDLDCKIDEPALCEVPPGDVCGMTSGYELDIVDLPYTNDTIDLCDYDADHPIVGFVGGSGSTGCESVDNRREAVFTYTAPSDQTVAITIQGAFDTVLNVSGACVGGDTLTSCLASDDVYGVGGDSGETVTMGLTAGQLIYIYVHGWGEAECGPFTFTIDEVVD